jgi:acyl-CoA reductase-like NAD-dependent aldehyde dehydrogenase
MLLIKDVKDATWHGKYFLDGWETGDAKLKAGGTFEKLFYRPTVLDAVKPGMRAFDEEIFGPASITTFSTDDEAIALANRTEYGLSHWWTGQLG